MALEQISKGWLDILDVAAKLLAAAAVVWGAYIANEFQATTAAATLQSQREQADSALRSSMFHDLIGPITGTEKGNLPVDREQLLVELLALNFHEHLELGPLMMHVDKRLKEIPGTDQEEARESLRSVARRVLQWQLALLTKRASGSQQDGQASTCRLYIGEGPSQKIPEEDLPLQPCGGFRFTFGELIDVDSPKKTYTLYFTVSLPRRWEEQSFPVLMQIINNEDAIEAKTLQEKKAIANKKDTDKKTKAVIADRDFLLTWFDFPFIDNTLLADGTRFSLVIDQVQPKEKKAVLKLVWFPKDYFSPRERPINYTDLREKLGLGHKE